MKWLAFAAFVTLTTALPEMFLGKLDGGFTSHLLENVSLNSGLPFESFGQDYMDQTWDHFNPGENRTFRQKWYHNKKFGSQSGPNFLMIGGESLEGPEFVTNEKLPLMIYAREVGANVFLLDHRYYGESKLGTNDLQYLTSAQALYDVATFIRAQQIEQNLTGPWITFGGSYPGMLAAWSREWFPDLIIGAVASSAPVLVKVDCYEYRETVQNVIRRHSHKCYDSISNAFDTLERLTQNPEGRAVIQEKFNLYPAWTSDPHQNIPALDINNLFATLADILTGPVQYNDVEWKAVAKLCSDFEDDSMDSLEALSTLRFRVYQQMPIWNFAIYIEYLKEIKNYVVLLWNWQKCYEFGDFPTTDYGEGIFGTAIPLNYYIIICEEVFGIGMDGVVNGVARTNRQYGGRDEFNATNVVFPNGDVNPWYQRGIIEQGKLDPSVVPILINGTSHCADMFEATAQDPPQLTQARKTILENIKKWLATASFPTARTSIATEQTTGATRPEASTT